MRKQSKLLKLFKYVSPYKILTVLSWILSAASALLALIPFVYIWKIIREVLEVAPNFNNTKELSHNGWMAVLFAAFSMIIYWCSNVFTYSSFPCASRNTFSGSTSCDYSGTRIHG